MPFQDHFKNVNLDIFSALFYSLLAACDGSICQKPMIVLKSENLKQFSGAKFARGICNAEHAQLIVGNCPGEPCAKGLCSARSTQQNLNASFCLPGCLGADMAHL
jgi:hypothetical protein